MIKFAYVLALLVFVRYCDHDPDHNTPVNVSLKEKWSTDSVLRTPESVLYNAKRRTIFVSNINGVNPQAKDGDGFISRLRPNGQIEKLQWVTGLNDPKGMGILHDKLYVADINEIVEIDIDEARIVNRFAAEGARFLNDITIDWRGNIYISDSQTGRIYLLKNRNVSVFLEGDSVQGPNGLLAEKSSLIMASFATGNVVRVDYDTKTIVPWVSGIPSADGVARDSRRNYFISSWPGEIYYVRASGQKTKVLDTRSSGVNSADIDFMEEGHIVLVPTFFDNRVVAYKAIYN